MENESPFMSGWDDPAVVAKRLGPALKSRGFISGPSDISSCVVSPLGGHSGLSGDLSLLAISLAPGAEGCATEKFVLKRTRPSEEGRLSSKRLGLHREAAFYGIIAPWLRERLGKPPSSALGDFIPRTLFSESDPVTGQKAIVLDFYENATVVGDFYPHSIHNRQGSGRPAPLPPIGRKSITLESVRTAARLHGAFYRDKSLLEPAIKPHLRMADWMQGLGRDTFMSSQRAVRSRWEKAKSEWERGKFYEGKVKMASDFVSVVDASMASALDFDSFVNMWSDAGDVRSPASDVNDAAVEKRLQWSLVHGDFHPGNLLCLHSNAAASQKSKSDDVEGNAPPRLILLDWEVVGLGSGPQDVGQYLISHLETREASVMLDEIASVYRGTLIETLVAADASRAGEAPSAADVKREIVYGGLERWIWLYSYMCGLVPPVYMQYFHDQMHGWISSFGVSADSVGMPRP